MNDKEFSKLANIEVVEFEQEQATVIINGVPQPNIVKVKRYALTCPVCKRIIYMFDDPILSYLDITRVITKDEDKLFEIAKYCPECGQKLSYKRDVYNPEEVVNPEN